MVIQHSTPWISSNDIHELKALLLSKQIADGKTVQTLTDYFEKKLNLSPFFLTNSGTHALYCILKLLRVQKNDEIIIPSYVCNSVFLAIQQSGAKPVLCDVEKYWLISPQKIYEKITKNTRGVVIPQLFGISIDLQVFRDLGIILISDLCQNFDEVYYSNKRDLGDIVFFSFHATKCITAANGGGFALINKNIDYNIDFLKKCSKFIQFSDMQATLLLSQLDRYSQFSINRRRIAQTYFEKIPDCLTKHIPRESNSFFRFPLIQEKYEFEVLEAFFSKKNIMIRRGVDSLLHRIVNENDKDFPGSVASFNSTVSVPIYPSLSLSNAEKIIKQIKEIFE